MRSRPFFAPIREIARHAEVGPATVYRHFPTKEMLATAVFTEHVLAWRSTLDQGLAGPGPWQAFASRWEALRAGPG
ncbi:TetR/AcrR family transcriptional regulator [Amycolatopsis sp. NPDC059657]|uniref:TetR/AcrR family transcriptional regulator n=1 Tax=Amycolatopsis sp. NPDC059657 TaxID=3346899 RepID=UPI003672A2DB